VLQWLGAVQQAVPMRTGLDVAVHDGAGVQVLRGRRKAKGVPEPFVRRKGSASQRDRSPPSCGSGREWGRRLRAVQHTAAVILAAPKGPGAS
jgi:hypothetical protein